MPKQLLKRGNKTIKINVKPSIPTPAELAKQPIPNMQPTPQTVARDFDIKRRLTL